MLEFNKSYKYKDLCEILNLECKTGSSKIYQIKRLQKQYEILKNGIYYTILREYTKEEKENNTQFEFNKSYTYSDICEIFNLPKEKGKKITNQINKLKKTYEIEKDGKYYTFLREYTEKEKQNRELKGVYQTYIKMILTDELSRREDGRMLCSTTELLNICKFINADYTQCRYNNYFASLVLDTNSETLECYIEGSYRILSRLIKDVLFQLMDKDLLIVTPTYRLIHTIDTGFGTALIKKKDILPKSKDWEKINKLQYELVKEMGYKDVAELYSKYCDKEKFELRMKELIKENYPEFNGYCKTYEIFSNKEVSASVSKDTKEELNKKIQAKLHGAKALTTIEELDKYVDATISLERGYKIQEAIMKYKIPEKYLKAIELTEKINKIDLLN